MSAEGKRRHHTPVVRPQIAHDVAPQRAVHDEAMQQDDDRAGAACVLILDNARRQLYFRHSAAPSARPSQTFVFACRTCGSVMPLHLMKPYRLLEALQTGLTLIREVEALASG
jgi:hypothetical protein